MDKARQDYVYLDWAATAPLCEEAAAAMKPYMAPGLDNLRAGGNANSLYGIGRDAFDAFEAARRSIASDLGAQRPSEIIFTSGATESDNMALFGISIAEAQRRRRQAGNKDKVFQVITTAVEHDAVLNPAKRLEAQGFRVRYLKPSKEGFIIPDALNEVLDEDTVLVSVQMANSEVGSIMPIQELADCAHKKGAYFHTDAVQALGKVPINLGQLGVDAASFSAHKIGGPKGVGALYLKARTPFEAFLLGGGQEEGRRSGTQNVCGAVGFAAACKASCGLQESEQKRLSHLRDKMYETVRDDKRVKATVSIKANDSRYLPNIVHLMIPGIESETLILRLDKEGFCVSGGSACASHSLEPSHVLRAMNISDDDAFCALRISMGRYTTEEDINNFLVALGGLLKNR
ncbi:MAG: cysteine desulfurase family protein [Eggerthellaceae bacterium]